MIQFKSFLGLTVEDTFTSGIVTDNISAIDGAVTFLSPVEMTQGIDMMATNISNAVAIAANVVTSPQVITSSISATTGAVQFESPVEITQGVNMFSTDLFGADTINGTTVQAITVDASQINTDDMKVSGDLDGGPFQLNIIKDVVMTNFDIDANRVTLGDKLYVTNTPGFTANPAQVHIQGTGSVGMFMEADTPDIIEADVPFILMSQDGGRTCFRLSGGAVANVYSLTASSVGATGMDLSLATCATNGTGVFPTISTVVPKIQIRATLTTSTQNISMAGNNLLSVGNLEVNQIFPNTAIGPDITVQSNVIIAGDLFLDGTSTGTPDQVLGIVTASGEVVSASLDDLLIFGTQFHSAESSAISTATLSVAYANKVTLTTGVIPAGTYRVAYSCLTACTNAGEWMELRFSEDTVVINVAPAVYGNIDNDNPAQYHSSYQTHVRVLSAGIHSYALDYRTNAPVPASISDATIEFWRVA